MTDDRLEVPGVPPGESPTSITVEINPDWWPYIIGACEELRDQSYWGVSDSEWLTLSQWVEELIEILTSA